MTLGERLVNLLFPPKCPFCARVLDEPGICAACEAALTWTQGEEQVQVLDGGVRCAAPLWYEDLARDAVLRLKFGASSASAEVLGGLIAQCAAERFSGEFDSVTWVPVSRRRLRSRGYDQARLLAQSACRSWGISPLMLVHKERENPAQSTMAGPAARRANVLGVYRADREKTTGRRVLLIDDVVTTGATLSECARELREAGAQAVVCAALCRTRETRDGASSAKIHKKDERTQNVLAKVSSGRYN